MWLLAAATHFPRMRFQMNVVLCRAVSCCAVSCCCHVLQVFPLSEVAAAHQQVETGHTRGKVVLQIP
jgi:hypothetical protein